MEHQAFRLLRVTVSTVITLFGALLVTAILVAATASSLLVLLSTSELGKMIAFLSMAAAFSYIWAYALELFALTKNRSATFLLINHPDAEHTGYCLRVR